jgi:hypothetical protein
VGQPVCTYLVFPDIDAFTPVAVHSWPPTHTVANLRHTSAACSTCCSTSRPAHTIPVPYTGSTSRCLKLECFPLQHAEAKELQLKEVEAQFAAAQPSPQQPQQDTGERHPEQRERLTAAAVRERTEQVQQLQQLRQLVAELKQAAKRGELSAQPAIMQCRHWSIPNAAAVSANIGP